ncbi:MAG: transcription-repair coupling factor, partial [Spirochaetaceae bacterium]|nr:transcription-repair coupling factor [Spirochaetaceae bacterium]
MKSQPVSPLVSAVRSAPSVAALLEALKKQSPCSLEVEGPEGAARALILALAAMARREAAGPGTILAVVPTEREAEDLAGDLNSFFPGTDPARPAPFRTTIFPWWGTLPYRDTPLSAVFGERTMALAAMVNARPAPAAKTAATASTAKAAAAAKASAAAGNAGSDLLVVAPERAFLTPLPSPEYFRGLLVPLTIGDTVDTAALGASLVEMGYIRVPRVQLHGEFALRGEVLDVLMGGDDEAYRVLLDFDQVESIKRFDPLDPNQGAAGNKLDSMTIRPLKEVIWTKETAAALEKNIAAMPEFTIDRKGTAALLERLRAGETVPGEELFFPLAFTGPGRAHTLLDYLGPGGTVCYLDRERLENARKILESEYQGLFRLARREKPVPSPDRILLDFGALAKGGVESGGENKPGSPSVVSFMGIRGEGENRRRVSCESSRSFFGNIEYLREEFGSLLKQGWTITVAAESEVQAARIEQLLRPADGEGQTGSPTGLSVVSLPLSAGFSLPDAKLMVVQENEIFGRRRRPPRSLSKVRSSPIDTFVELNSGDYVVHVNYGIGLFKGIERIRSRGHERDYVKIEYLDDEAVFVPIEQVNLVQRYIGSEGTPPRLDKLGSKSWENRKGRVRKSVEDIAEGLILLYSKRKAAPGFAFPPDTEWQLLFEAAFPFEETEDQLRCVEEIKTDMEAPHPMDRLVCGDVGYGKTEVAVRACFKAVMGGKQVAFLAPTTILAEQHYENFKERFSQFPVTLAMLSRFVGPAESGRILDAAARGEVDILVGTHRIIQKDVAFKDLGLLVVDEEQRFGVKDKEKLKELKINVDCLSLSATPIPRTLHMSLLKIRDMSLLSTPPLNRHPIETAIGPFDEDRVAAAIRAEAERGGQVFFLHNRIEDLREVRIMLERIVPEMSVETAHGQMDARDLEDVMRRFIHGGFHVLVSTTIIENGIDIPNVNTIIIDRSDMYGISQLYQLRGRVGRSDRVAYAYLFYPGGRSLSELAIRRLQVISDFTELGSGFKIALKDLEIRGAGNLLGREQSGDIFSVGFDLYIRLLDEAVRKLENENYEAETEPLLELEYSGFIPDPYIDSPQEKMEVYKKIAAVKTREELEGLHAELADRFGPPPDEAASLLALAEIRIICRELEVSSLKEKAGLVRVEFG